MRIFKGLPIAPTKTQDKKKLSVIGLQTWAISHSLTLTLTKPSEHLFNFAQQKRSLRKYINIIVTDFISRHTHTLYIGELEHSCIKYGIQNSFTNVLLEKLYWLYTINMRITKEFTSNIFFFLRIDQSVGLT